MKVKHQPGMTNCQFPETTGTKAPGRPGATGPPRTTSRREAASQGELPGFSNNKLHGEKSDGGVGWGGAGLWTETDLGDFQPTPTEGSHSGPDTDDKRRNPSKQDP